MEYLDKPSFEFKEAAKTLGIDVVELDVEASDYLRQKIILYHTNLKKYKFPLWEHLVNTLSIRCEYGWEKLDTILKDEKVLFFFEFYDDGSFFLIKDGARLGIILENCYRFVFYITNASVDYVISYNDHDYFIYSKKAETFFNRLLF